MAVVVAACSRGGGVEVRALDCTITAPAGVAVATRRCELVSGAPSWGGHIENQGAEPLEDLSVEVIARDRAGAELGRDRFDVTSFEGRLAHLYPSYGVDAPQTSSTVLRTPAASLDVVVSARRDASDAVPFEPAEVTWRSPPPAGAAIEVRAGWCGTGPEGIGPSEGRMIFDCLLGVRNTGTVALSRIDLQVAFVDAAGAEVDRVALAGGQQWPLRPGESLLFTGARGVRVHAHSRLEAEIR